MKKRPALVWIDAGEAAKMEEMGYQVTTGTTRGKRGFRHYADPEDLRAFYARKMGLVVEPPKAHANR